MKTSSEIDFLLELEYRLQSDLNKVHERLEELLGGTAVRHLALVTELPDGAA